MADDSDSVSSECTNVTISDEEIAYFFIYGFLEETKEKHGDLSDELSEDTIKKLEIYFKDQPEDDRKEFISNLNLFQEKQKKG